MRRWDPARLTWNFFHPEKFPIVCADLHEGLVRWIPLTEPTTNRAPTLNTLCRYISLPCWNVSLRFQNGVDCAMLSITQPPSGAASKLRPLWGTNWGYCNSIQICFWEDWFWGDWGHGRHQKVGGRLCTVEFGNPDAGYGFSTCAWRNAVFGNGLFPPDVEMK